MVVCHGSFVTIMKIVSELIAEALLVLFFICNAA